jgi:F-type H+-transporting ATPase subunit gamma
MFTPAPSVGKIGFGSGGPAIPMKPPTAMGLIGSANQSSMWHPGQTPSAPNVRKRTSTVLMAGAGELQQYRTRLKQTDQSIRITGAMKLVAAAKVRRAQSAVLSSRPFSETLASIIVNLFGKLKSTGLIDSSPYMEQRDVKNVSLLVVSGNRGLCGAYNSKVIKLAEQRVKYLEEAGIGVQMIFVGRKAHEYF